MSVAAGGAALLLGSCLFAAPGHEGPPSAHFNGREFRNQVEADPKGVGDLLKWWRSQDRGPWKPYTHHEPGPPPPAQVEVGQLRVTFINHATTLIQLDGVNIITDPIYSKRASPVRFAGPKRVRPPGIRFEDLPRIHLVLVSHNHYDHLDIPTLGRLEKAHGPMILTGLGNSRLLASRGMERAMDLDWWESVAITHEVRVHFVPAQHWSQRGLGDRNRTLWGGFVIEGRSHRVYFAGDTGFGPHFAQIRQRFGPPSLALLPVGVFRPRWLMRDMHLNPSDAVRAHRTLEAKRSVGIHLGTFRLGDDGQEEPERELHKALKEAGIAKERFQILGFGEGMDVPPDAL